MSETVTVKGDNLTIDLLLWRKHGVRGRELVEQTLEMNRGLSDAGPILPLGAEVILPDLLPATRVERTVVTLFG